MEVISCSRMSNQSRILLEDHSTGRLRVVKYVCDSKGKGERERKIEEGSEKHIPNYPSCFAKPAGQPNKHSVHLCPLRASHTSKTFTKYPLTTHSLLCVSGVVIFSLASSLARSLSLSLLTNYFREKQIFKDLFCVLLYKSELVSFPPLYSLHMK